MNKTIGLLFLLLVSHLIHGQKKGDIGVFAGGSYYLGEINPTIQFRETLPAFGVFYRHVYNLRWSLRGNVYYGKLTGSDSSSDYDFHQLRNHSFHLEIIDIGASAEFNFLPYITTSAKYNFAPYVTAGLSYMTSLSDKVENTMTIPFGIGFKVNISERMSAGCEWVWRNTFSDELDGLGKYKTDPLQEEFLNDKTAELYRQRSLFYRNDFYVFTGVFIAYKFAYKRYRCPAYGEIDMVE